MAIRTYPNRAIVGVPHLGAERAQQAAIDAALFARQYAPKMSGHSSARFYPVWSDEWFGVTWDHPYVWFQEAGIRPFTMNNLAGKTIPMWINDPDGTERAKNPKAPTRQTVDGRTQVLIFRRAAKMGQRKKVWRMVNGQMTRATVPASYPGAPGRIAVNRSQNLIRSRDVDPSTTNPGWIAPANVGVRWRSPGINPGRFLARGLYVAAIKNGLPIADVEYMLPGATKSAYAAFHIVVSAA